MERSLAMVLKCLATIGQLPLPLPLGGVKQGLCTPPLPLLKGGEGRGVEFRALVTRTKPVYDLSYQHTVSLSLHSGTGINARSEGRVPPTGHPPTTLPAAAPFSPEVSYPSTDPAHTLASAGQLQ